MSDLVIVVARTDPDAGHQGISLLVVERGMAGFERGRNLDKMGLKAQDTAELFFDNVDVPEGEPARRGGLRLRLADGQTCPRSGSRSPRSRSRPASTCWTCAWTTPRSARRSARPIGSFQHNRFLLAEMATEVHIARVFVNDCILELNAGEVDTALASMAKWWTTELQKKLVDQGVQLHGGYGYMIEYPIAKAYVDSRIQTIYGGTTEIQKEIIGRSLGI